LKMRLLLVSLASVAIIAMLLAGAAHAIDVETGIIDSKPLPSTGELSAVSGNDGIYVTANCTSWWKWEILPHHTYEFEWITVGTGGGQYLYYVQVYGSGILTVGFDSFITISSISFSNTTGSGTCTVLEGGVGYDYATIYLNGTCSWAYNIVTGNIASNYWGSNTNINMTVQEGEDFNSASCTLGI